MSKNDRRIYTTYSPDTYQAIRRLALLTGRPMSQIVGETMEQLVPQMEQIAEAISKAQLMAKTASDEFRQTLAKIENTGQASAKSLFDDLQVAITAEAARVSRPPSGRGARARAVPPE